MSRVPVQIVFDALDPVALGTFWAAALSDRGYRMPGPPDGFDDWPAFLRAQGVPEEEWGSAFALEVDDGSQPRLFFQRVPEPKIAKSRIHLDLQAGGGHRVPMDEQRRRVAAEVARIEALGATRVQEFTELGVHWTVMRDPEGNEFCV